VSSSGKNQCGVASLEIIQSTKRFIMKKATLRATVAALAVTLFVAPMGFAQTPVVQTVTQKSDTQPLPGARKASQVVFAGMTLGEAITAGIVLATAIGVGLYQYQVNQDKDNDSRVIAQYIINASGTTGTTGTR
jgi:hypothetical protein